MTQQEEILANQRFYRVELNTLTFGCNDDGTPCIKVLGQVDKNATESLALNMRKFPVNYDKKEDCESATVDLLNTFGIPMEEVPTVHESCFADKTDEYNEAKKAVKDALIKQHQDESKAKDAKTVTVTQNPDPTLKTE